MADRIVAVTAISPEQPSTDIGSTVGRLVSVNVGLPRDVEWRGRTVHTGVWKRAVEGPRMVRELNVDGDGQGDLAGHGGPNRAVLVYQLASYEHWKQFLGRDDFDYGQFGENFTVAGLPDDEVCIGDQYQIGEALFEVSQPRVTCYRVGLRLGEPRLPALLVSHHRPGFYLRVLREGVVEAGAPILKVRTGPEQMSVSAVDGLLYLPGHDRADVQRALRIPALSPGWRESFQALSSTGEGVTGNAGLNEASGEAPAAWPGFRAVRVVEVVAESETVVSLQLEATDGQGLPAALPGQFVVLRLDLADGQPPASRSYSLSGPPGTSGYRVSVKRERGGAFSSFVHTRIHPGSVLEMSAPRGRFTLAAADAPVLLVSAGIGATPVLSMLHALVVDAAPRAVWWLHGARNSTEHVFATEAGELLAQLPGARSQICYSSPLPTDTPGKDYTHRGRLDSDFLTSLSIPVDALAYLCGPEVFMDDVRAALTQTGLRPAHIHSEVFGAAASMTPGIAARAATLPHPPPGQEGSGPSVTFSRSALTVPWREDFGSVLELAEACDVPTRWSCRTGICHTCETGLLAGGVSYEPVPIDLPAEGHVLVCCAVPSDDMVLDL